MSKPQVQIGHVYERSGAFHLRYNVHENGVRKQKSRKLCDKTDSTPSKDAHSVLKLAEDFMLTINAANALNDSFKGHNCPICGNRCPRNIQGKFTKKV